MAQVRENGQLTVLVCREAGGSSGDLPRLYDGMRDRLADPALAAILAEVAGDAADVYLVGPRPKKAIDPLLAGRVLVVGDDADLNAVVLRLVRRELLGEVAVAYAAASPTAFTRIHSLPTGPRAVRLALLGEVDLVPIVRSDAGGVLVGAAQLAPIIGTFYVDENRIPGGSARVIDVQPDAAGVAVTVVRRRVLGFGPRPRTFAGRAVEFGILPGSNTTITYDGIRHPRATNRWVFYQNAEPLRLVRGVF